MFKVVLIALTAVAADSVVDWGTKEKPVYGGEIVLQDGVEDVVKTEIPKSDSLPKNWDWRDSGYLSTDLNQHIPVYCGSCWAHAAASSIADRIAIQSQGLKRDVLPAIQVLLNCGTAGSCGGGDSHAAYRWIYQNSIPDVTCQQYTATDGECTPEAVCMNCDPGGGACYAVTEYPNITVSEYGRVFGDENIMQEIYNRGPVAASINANCIKNYTAGTVAMYEETDTGSECHPYFFDHYIQLAGWGTDENGLDYWVARNSWGTYYGERGFFKVVRGGNYNPLMGLWVVPDVPDF